MIYLNCDYNEGAQERIIERLAQTNLEQSVGYGQDAYCEKAAELIREKCGKPKAGVHFLVGGTQTNETVITALLRPYQGVIAPDTGHISTHETGAIEAGGHKVLTLPGTDGKLTAEQVEACYLAHAEDETREHMVQPGMVYISQPTEWGTLYSLAELKALSQVCRRYGLILYADGARLGYGLTGQDNDVSLSNMAELCDIFYIGGTKVGALFGEAVVIPDVRLQQDFRYMMKQKGGLLAKGRLLGLQFLALFEDDLYCEGAAHGNCMADQIRETLKALQVPFWVENCTNQIFPILPDAVWKKLGEKYCFSYEKRISETESVMRICTSWATKPETAAELCEDLKACIGG